MSYNPNLHHRRSIRLKGYDYSQAGAYFLTICTQHRKCLFGEIIDGEVHLNPAGQIISDSWEWLATQYPYVDLDAWVIMPNHLHGIVVISDQGGSRTALTEKRKPIGRLVGAFKTVSTKRINEFHKTPAMKLWQRNYWEHIVRNASELNRLREYIRNNPAKWALDRLNPGRGKSSYVPEGE
jgi:REP element-mobilizing transposase RayT